MCCVNKVTRSLVSELNRKKRFVHELQCSVGIFALRFADLQFTSLSTPAAVIVMLDLLLFQSSGLVVPFVVVLGIIVYLFTKSMLKKDEGNMPPLAPRTWRENVRHISTIEGAAASWYLKDLGEAIYSKLLAEGKKPDTGDKTTHSW